jgi:hypothetical protein
MAKSIGGYRRPSGVADLMAKAIGYGGVGRPSGVADLMSKSIGYGGVGRPSGVADLMTKSNGYGNVRPGSVADAIGAIVNPYNQPGVQALLGNLAFPGPIFDATAYRSPLERAIGSGPARVVEAQVREVVVEATADVPVERRSRLVLPTAADLWTGTMGTLWGAGICAAVALWRQKVAQVGVEDAWPEFVGVLIALSAALEWANRKF